MVKILASKSICLNFPRTVNKTHTDRAILKFSTQPEKKYFSHAFKSANCKKKEKFLHMCSWYTCFAKWFLLHAITGTFLIHLITGSKLLKSKKSPWKTLVKEFIFTGRLFSMILLIFKLSPPFRGKFRNIYFLTLPWVGCSRKN